MKYACFSGLFKKWKKSQGLGKNKERTGTDVEEEEDNMIEDDEEEEEEEDEEEEAEVEETKTSNIKKPDVKNGKDEEDEKEVPGAYNPNQYANLAVAQELKEMFEYIQRYKP